MERSIPEYSVLVEFKPEAGVKQVTSAPGDLAVQSAKAVDSAMQTIQAMATRITGTLKELAQPPSGVELEFGIKLEARGNALLASAGAGSHLTVKLSWQQEVPDAAS